MQLENEDLLVYYEAFSSGSMNVYGNVLQIKLCSEEGEFADDEQKTCLSCDPAACAECRINPTNCQRCPGTDYLLTNAEGRKTCQSINLRGPSSSKKKCLSSFQVLSLMPLRFFLANYYQSDLLTYMRLQII